MRPRIKGERWYDCARCGFKWPESHLRKNAKGNRICPKCWDENEMEDTA